MTLSLHGTGIGCPTWKKVVSVIVALFIMAPVAITIFNHLTA